MRVQIMTPAEFQEWAKNCTLQELVDNCIWDAIMVETAHCGWTDEAREGLVKSVQENVKWALEKKLGDTSKIVGEKCP